MRHTMGVQRIGNPQNPINAKNFTANSAEKRRAEIQKARQNFQQNSFLVGSPPIVYYQQVRSGYTCTCHAIEKTLEEPIHTMIVQPDVPTSFTNKVTEVSFSTLSKAPMFGTLPTEDLTDEEDLLLDDSDVGVSGSSNPLFSNIFHKGTDCGICFRTGFTPLLQPLGRQFYALTTHNYVGLSGYRVDNLKSPNVFTNLVGRDSAVEFKIKVPKYYTTCRYAVFNNTFHVTTSLKINGVNLTKDVLASHKGQAVILQVGEFDFTHVFIEFELGLEIKANFPQFSLTKDYTYFFNLQQVTIELPPTICNPQVNDLIYVDEWKRLWMIFDVQSHYDSPLQTVLLGTTVQGRLVQTVETARILTQLKELR